MLQWFVEVFNNFVDCKVNWLQFEELPTSLKHINYLIKIMMFGFIKTEENVTIMGKGGGKG